MSGTAELAPVLAAGGPRLTELLGRAEGRLAEAVRDQGDVLAEHAGETLAAGGKRLRPVFVFLCGAPLDGGDPPADGALVAAATAVELLHMATLVHDDVLDRAPLRRGRPTVFAAAGRATATATGDLLFARAFAQLVGTGREDAVRALSTASSALARGELMQRADAWSPTVTPERYAERCRLKTGTLFAACCRLGALLGEPGPAAAAPLARFGERVGLAFQLLDDVLDVSGPVERTGKPRGIDLLDGTVTLPLIVARRREPSLSAVDLRDEVRDAAAAEALCDAIAATGALEEVRAEALDQVARAKRELDRLALTERRHQALALVADGVVERYA